MDAAQQQQFMQQYFFELPIDVRRRIYIWKRILEFTDRHTWCERCKSWRMKSTCDNCRKTILCWYCDGVDCSDCGKEFCRYCANRFCLLKKCQFCPSKLCRSCATEDETGYGDTYWKCKQHIDRDHCGYCREERCYWCDP